MDPSSNERTGLNLPSPMNEQAPVQPDNAETPKTLPEATPIASEKAPVHSQPAAAMPAPLPLPAAAGAGQFAATNDVSNTTQLSLPAVADDSDLIEKEWVNKAKQIVEHNRDDPYKQSKEITVFKADYMKKRYNKTIKLSE